MKYRKGRHLKTGQQEFVDTYIRAMRLFWLTTLVLFTQALQAQRYVFMQWGTDNGLPTSTINDIAEDPLGFIWLATDGAGLVRFDGTTFTQPIAADSLPSPFVTVIETTGQDFFWIGTERGPALYDGLTLIQLKTLPQELRTRINAIYAISKDSVWFATRNGLFLYNGSTFSQPIAALKGTEVLGIGNVAQGMISATASGLYLHNTANTNKPNPILPNLGMPFRLRRINKGVIVTAQSGTYRIADVNTPKKLSPQNDIRDVITHSDTLLLASATNGLQFGPYLINRESGLAYDRVQCLYKSSSGTIWVGSLSGLSKLTTPYLVVYDEQQGLPDERIHAVYTAKNGETWVGSANSISRFSDNYQNKMHFTGANGLPDGLVLAITEDAQGAIWVGTERGLARFTQGRFSPVPAFDAFVFTLKYYQEQLYIGTATGLFVYGRSGLTQRNDIDQGIVQLEAHDQKLLGLTFGGKLVNISKEKITPITNFNNLALDTCRITHMTSLGSSGIALSVAGKGIYVCTNADCYLLDERNGIRTLNIKALAASAKRLWVGTDDGLYSISFAAGDTQMVTSYRAEAGFLANATNERSLIHNKRGEIIVGTNSGVYVIQEAEFAQPHQNSVYVTGVDLFFKPIRWQAEVALLRWKGIPKKMILPYDQNYLTFHFASSDFSGNRAFWRYKLVGQDKDWTLADNRLEAIFTNIPPGTYTLKVERAQHSNFKNAAVTQLPVTIIPPYYQRWWFISAVIIAATLVVFFGVRYRINQLNARLQLEAALAESERKALRLQMNPHFVFNALDAISGFIFKNEPKEAVRYLTSFAKLMRLTLESSRETTVPLQNELQLLKNYIVLEQVRFSMNFTYTLEVDDVLDPFDCNIPPMLLQPFVENAILHGLRHRKEPGGALKIAFTLQNQRLNVTIEDNGVGRAQSATQQTKTNKKSLATSITTERIKLLSKSLGAPVTFSILDLTNDVGQPCGTRVILTLPLLATEDYT